MCVVSMIYDYGKKNFPNYPWTQHQYDKFQDLIDKAKIVDEIFGQPDCVDPEKEKFAKQIKDNLQKDKILSPQQLREENNVDDQIKELILNINEVFREYDIDENKIRVYIDITKYNDMVIKHITKILTNNNWLVRIITNKDGIYIRHLEISEK